jgi:lysophospholipase L1-like esterase
MVKPIRIFILLFYIGLMSALLLAMSPGEVPLSPEITVKVPTIFDFFPKPDSSNLADMSEFLEFEKKIKENEKKQTQKIEIIPESRDSVTVKSIQYPKDQENALFGFFESLSELNQSETGFIRVLHYGDSQLEGDRITEYLRKQLQHQFGGCGVGFVPITEVNNLRSTLQTSAWKYWEKFTIYGSSPKPSPHKKFGILGNYHSFKLPEGEQGYGPWVEYQTTAISDSLCRKAQLVKVFFRSPNGDLALRLAADNGEWIEQMASPSEELQQITFPLKKENFKKLRLEFNSPDEVEVNGVALDCEKGIAVDNIPMRGSSGTDFLKMNRSYLAAQFKSLKVKLIIYQFGVNVVPYLIEDFGFYENAVFAQLKFLKSLSEDLKIDILVIGTSDMARKEGELYESYPNIKAIRNAQKQAAFRAGCPFWDLYEAMGGHNSMNNWVKIGFAAKDYTHFSNKGARVVSELFYNELMKEYKHYLKLKEKQTKKFGFF